MYFYLILALQVFCVYHCYTHKNDYYWIFLIIFLPVIGSAIYLFVHVFQKKDIEQLQDGVVSVLNPSKKIKDLEKKFKFSDTFENQVALADAYLEGQMYEEAIKNYEASLKDVFENDFYVHSKLVGAYYFSSNFDKAIHISNKIKDNSKFKKSETAFLFALAIEKSGGSKEMAEEYLMQFDTPYSRYRERLELAKFYVRAGKTDESKTILEEIIKESEGMSKTGYRQNRVWIKKAREILAANV
ncbi:hypothetical protein [Maribacter sp. 2304DJ31-5]|uniref:hypothetical protein n=1 Tax=Maribacter sp. 2304DJ31-5 TaxID=3386273 RepID=UPI0039BC8BBD